MGETSIEFDGGGLGVGESAKKSDAGGLGVVR